MKELGYAFTAEIIYFKSRQKIAALRLTPCSLVLLTHAYRLERSGPGDLSNEVRICRYRSSRGLRAERCCASAATLRNEGEAEEGGERAEATLPVRFHPVSLKYYF